MNKNRKVEELVSYLQFQSSSLKAQIQYLQDSQPETETPKLKLKSPRIQATNDQPHAKSKTPDAATELITFPTGEFHKNFIIEGLFFFLFSIS